MIGIGYGFMNFGWAIERTAINSIIQDQVLIRLNQKKSGTRVIMTSPPSHTRAVITDKSTSKRPISYLNYIFENVLFPRRRRRISRKP
ncbi:hypothetical protein [Methanoregula sp.]|uniref:hypothetical protein n=1 Tax=Methanoregula sp. TaxID=2052170 RepID=UPI003C77FF2F